MIERHYGAAAPADDDIPDPKDFLGSFTEEKRMERNRTRMAMYGTKKSPPGKANIASTVTFARSILKRMKIQRDEKVDAAKENAAMTERLVRCWAAMNFGYKAVHDTDNFHITHYIIRTLCILL